MAVKKIVSFCPDCYLATGTDTPLESRPGSIPRCAAGHVFEDMEIMDHHESMARQKRLAVDKANNPEPEVKPTVSAVEKVTGNELTIREQDRKRLASLLGNFTDGASLFGSVFALSQDLKTLQDEVNALRAKPVPADIIQPGVQTAGGDLPVTILVPEEYIQPLREISEANGTDLVGYMNAVIQNGFASQWFFAIMCAIGGLTWHALSIQIPMA
jgi:hypothetical protein